MVLISVLTMIVAAQTPRVPREAELYEDCKAEIKVLNGSYDPRDALPGSSCIGYLEGIMDGARAGGLQFCTGGGFTPSTLVKLYIRFMDQNPLYLDKQKLEGAVASFTAAYPCPVK